MSRSEIPARDASLYRCVHCHKTGLTAGQSGFQCTGCGASFPVTRGILDTLVRPHPEVIREMQGMALEAGIGVDRWAEIKITRTAKYLALEDRLKMTEADPTAYYTQTQMSIEQAFGQVRHLKPKRVLEIGAEPDFHNLRKFKELGASCFAANLTYPLRDDDEGFDWPECSLADMNNLPYADGVFDLVYMSATSHHSPRIEDTMGELARVLKPGGVALVLNDQISGLFKVLGDGHRHDYIHENFYSIFRYHAAFLTRGFRPQYLFADYYDKKLTEATIHPDVRFAALGRAVAVPWRVPLFRRLAKKALLWPAHALFGFPLNVILWKK